MSDFNVIFNGASMPSFLKVVKVHQSILPTITQNTLTVPGRYGAVPFGNELGARVIDLDVILFTDRLDNMPMYARQLAQWLMYNEPKKLLLSDNPGKYYMAMFSGDSTIDEIFTIGRTTLSFICYDPLQYGEEERTPINLNGETQITNIGTAPSYPMIRFKVNQNLTGITLVGSDDFVDIGSPLTVDTTPQEYEPYVFKDFLTSYSGWTQSNGLPGATINLDMDAWEIWDNSVFRINSDRWVDGSKWHGGAIQKSFGTSAQDFECIIPVHFNGKNSRARGNIQTNILGENGQYVFKISYKDGSLSNTECAVTVTLLDGSGGEKKVFDYKIASKYRDFIGCVYVTRKGTKWDFKLRRKNGKNYDWGSSKGLQTLKSSSYVDTKKKYMQPIKTVQLAILMYGNYKDEEGSKKDEKRNYMSIYNVFIKNLKQYKPSPNTTPMIIYSGDEIAINCETGEVFKNDDYFMDFLNPNSTFISFDNLHNALSVLPEGCIQEGEVILKPAWY